MDAFVHELRVLGIEVECGRFGADMQVTLTNDGPVTIWIDSAARVDELVPGTNYSLSLSTACW